MIAFTHRIRKRAEAACELGRRPTEAASATPILLSMLSDDVTVPAIECEMSPWLRRTLPVSPDAQKWMETSPAKEAAEALGDIANLAVPRRRMRTAKCAAPRRTHFASSVTDVTSGSNLIRCATRSWDRFVSHEAQG